MNGAESLRDTLLACGVDVCFANPGTSEMHFVAALDREPRMRCVLGLAEGVVTGAADGYGRMTGRPAATLLHLGPGLANGLANLHNARRARTPLINVVGDHASYHLALDAPLTSDIESLARPMSHFVRRISGPDDVAVATIEACRAARELPGIATLILPADAAWSAVVAPVPDGAAAPVLSASSTAGGAITYASTTPAVCTVSGSTVADVAIDGVLVVGLNKTLPIDLPRATRDVVVGDPTTADVLVRAPHQVFVMGRKIGDTNIFFMDRNGELIRRVELHVGPDAASAQAAISRILPDDDIAVSTQRIGCLP